MTRDELLKKYKAVRQASMDMVKPLEPEDFRIQSMPDVSPPWWNLGHTSWFFAKNIIEPFGKGLPEDRRLEYVLNSYYIALGPRVPRVDRGKLTRPTTREIFSYRESVDLRIQDLIRTVPDEEYSRLADLAVIGVNHEQQHQELFYTEIKHIYYMNPSGIGEPYLKSSTDEEKRPAGENIFIPFTGGLFEFGNTNGEWSWDNEYPVHKYYLENFELANRLVTNAEFLEFIEDGGYENPLLWLDNGFAAAAEGRWGNPLYWEEMNGEWEIWTLSGRKKLNPDEPVCHVSFYEADAFVRWKEKTFDEFRGVRLPQEREWEHAAREAGVRSEDGNLTGTHRFHPSPASAVSGKLVQMIGDVWEWTSDAYRPYPGFRPYSGALAEYNGKFMDGQYVLRGGSAVTSDDHIRISYRNFWHPATRFQFTGIRLGRDL